MANSLDRWRDHEMDGRVALLMDDLLAMAGWMFLSMDDLIAGLLDRWRDHKMAGWMDISMDDGMVGV